jgi:hypothetical protein
MRAAGDAVGIEAQAEVGTCVMWCADTVSGRKEQDLTKRPEPR